MSSQAAASNDVERADALRRARLPNLICNVEIPGNAKNVLAEEGFVTLEEVAAYGVKRLIGFKGIGALSLSAITALLVERGLIDAHGEPRAEDKTEAPRLDAPLGQPELGTSDARAQLWARVYAAEFEQQRTCLRAHPEICRHDARQQADAAVRDFDQHYLGGKRS